jgi:hypothetical protein
VPWKNWFKTSHGVSSLLALLFTPLFSPPALGQTQTPIFPTPILSSSTVVAGAAMGDFNRDGLSDQAYISSTTITVLLNQGPNNPPTPVVTGGLTCSPQALVAGDMNNDKELDIVFTCKEGYVGVLFGNGDGTFQTPSYYAVAGTTSIAPPVDLNGDGYLDIAVGSIIFNPSGPPSSSSSAVVVLLNQGTAAPGALSSPKNYSVPTGVEVSSITVGDFNGDGKSDLIAGAPVVVFYGNGDGTLQNPVQTSATLSFVIGDFNRDGLTDIAYFSAPVQPANTTASLQILLGNSSGQFTTAATLPLFTTQAYQSIVPFKNTASSNTINLALIGADTLIALGDGSGNFTAGQAYGVSGNPVVAQVESNGNTDLLFQNGQIVGQTVLVPGNGDGTFQAPPATLFQDGTSAFLTADLNGDGLTDVLTINTAGNFVAALGRGNGRFSITSQISGTGQLAVAGDFNGDGKVDVVTIFPGQFDPKTGSPISNGQLFFYSGNGDGSFQPASAAMGLPVGGALTPLVGDFNSDGRLDLVLPYGGEVPYGTPASGVLFLAGNGDGTFAAPISVSIPWTSVLFAADVNKDKKLDILGGNTVNLGNGDGTFRQQPLGIPGTLFAVGDLNGDGNPDLVIQVATNDPYGVYAGNGDGTFQTTPFYTACQLPYYLNGSAVIGDVHADGHADLLIQCMSGESVLLGDGKGNFAADPNTYFGGAGFVTLARLNNQAPGLPNDNALDLLYGGLDGGAAVTSLINQLNPAPTTPAPLPSSTKLAASLNSAAPTQQITFTATVMGITPTGKVNFTFGNTTLGTSTITTNGLAPIVVSFPTIGSYPVIANYAGDGNNAPSSSAVVSVTITKVASTIGLNASALTPGTNQSLTFSSSVSGLNPSGTVTFSLAGGTTLGTATITQGAATFAYAFSTAGTYSVIASYSGDVANLPSTSASVAVNAMGPNFSVSSSNSSATVSAGQSVTTAININPAFGYAGTISFSCSGLTTGESCTFMPPTISAQANGAPLSSTLVISTTAPSSARMRVLAQPTQKIAWAILLCVAFSPKRIWRLNRRLTRASVLTLLLAIGLIDVSGCGASSSPSTPQNNGTPRGTQTITVNAADSAGVLSHAISLQLTVL